jgi:hypothetical protein
MPERFQTVRQWRSKRPPLTVDQVMAWADAHHAATGRWPSRRAGRIREAPFGEDWRSIDDALIYGYRALPAGLSIARLLEAQRGVKHRVRTEKRQACVGLRGELLAARRRGRVALSLESILAWADAFFASKDRWPTFRDGPIEGVPGETWGTINTALAQKRRGLRRATTLRRLLADHRRRQGQDGSCDLSVETILAWADAHHARHGSWPVETSGQVDECPSEDWDGLGRALSRGERGLPGGSSLSHVLAQHRGLQSEREISDLSIEQILDWADAEHAATGRWPTRSWGDVCEAPGEDWRSINRALRQGVRGLPGGSSLSRLLSEHRPAYRRSNLTLEKIRTWAEAYRRTHGVWPSAGSGPVADAPGEDWVGIDQALRRGSRGLPVNGVSLTQLLGRSADPSLRGSRPKLTVAQIMAWGDAYHAAHGRWPTVSAGAVVGAPGEKWVNINQVLWSGRRGLPGGMTLKRLFADRPAPGRTS